MLRYLYILFFLIVTAAGIKPTHAQNKTIDSLLNLLKKDKPDTIKAIHLNELCWEYYKVGSNDTAFRYGNAALKLAKHLNFPAGIASSYSSIGIIYKNQSNYVKALENHFASLKIRQETGDKKGIASSYNNIGIIYDKQGNYEKALENYFASLKIRKEIGDKMGIAISYNNIGIIYDNQGNYDKALENYFNSLKIRKETGDKKGIADSYDNIGVLYYNQRNYDKSLENYFASLKIREEIGDKKGIASSYHNIGILYKDKNDFTQSIAYLNNSLHLSQEIGPKDLVMKTYEVLSEVNKKMSDYHNAYKYHQLYSQYKDSIFNEESSKQIAEMQTKYETEKKEKQIELLSKEQEIQTLKIAEQSNQINQNRILQGVLLIMLILIIAVSILGYTRYKIAQRERLKSELLKQQEKYTLAIIETQEAERKRIAQDLHDGIGHKLTTLKLNFERIAEGFRTISAEEKIIFEQTENILDETHKEVRTLSHSMMPKALQERELADAVSDLVEQALANSSLKYSFKNDLPADLPENIQVCLYRVLQELLNNILKHAQATEIAVQIFKNKNTIIMMAEDNGIGIQPAYIKVSAGINDTSAGGIGLHNITGRINALNGIFTIEPGPIKGTVATVRIPLTRTQIE